MAYSPRQILEALSHVRYPGSGQDVVSAGMVEDDIRIEGNKISFSLLIQKKNDPFIRSLVKACEQAILSYVDSKADIQGHISVKIPPPAETEKPLPEVRRIIAVASGKGGVGKSLVAANLAVALSRLGYRVGLLDADIHGPSQPKMFGVEDARPVSEEIEGRTYIVPVEKFGIKLLSIGFFVSPDTALVWRGAMAGNALKQLLTDGLWGALDFLILDMPPGTGDIHLTLVQTIRLDGAIVVSTPQQVALADARKGIQMYQNDKIGIPIIGLIENMAWFTPAELPENRYYIFGKEGCKQLAAELNVPLLAQIPIVQSLCESGDAGQPVAADDDSPSGALFIELAKKISGYNAS
ncbi:MAG: Mrp/NBP35 family ATP-binding protein [Prevotellaceae bacterium]|jgi:ATP-binding protein involved in chromosome partitioning|nr:Mrp/NBP35 family ATP-binding protein [Prevotellaceae bacterium]